MRICLVSLAGLPCQLVEPRGTRGGSELQTTLLARALAARGHEVSMVVTDYAGDALTAPRLTDFPLVNAYNTGGGIRGIRFVTRWWRLDRALGRADAEVYYQRGALALTGQVALFARRCRRGFVFGAASDTDVDPRSVRIGPGYRRLYRMGLVRADRVVTQHRAQADRLREGYGIDSTVIGSIAPFLPETMRAPADPPVVAWLGNFRALKRPEIFLAAARRFPGARFVMMGGTVGTDPGAYRRTREAAAEIPNVEFLGPVTDPERVLAGAWVLLNTSELEGFPSSFLEAWVHGVPSVSFVDPGGVVSGQGLGLVADSPGTLFAGLGKVLGSRRLRDELGTRARGHVLREHGGQAVASRYEALFREAVAGRASGENPGRPGRRRKG